jgi:hypothetical protein
VDLLIFALYFLVVVLTLALLANVSRKRRNYKFDLVPNCLLTRWNVLFVTGPRSMFYFTNYWNIYPVFLAEHGYEVFTLHMPWSKPALRAKYFRHFLEKQSELNRHFHLVMDSSTLSEFQEMLRQEKPACIASVTEISDPNAAEVVTGLKPFPVPFERVMTLPEKNNGNWMWRLAFDLHRGLKAGHYIPELSTLGGNPSVELENAKLLLERVRVLAETDLQES